MGPAATMLERARKSTIRLIEAISKGRIKAVEDMGSAVLGGNEMKCWTELLRTRSRGEQRKNDKEKSVTRKAAVLDVDGEPIQTTLPREERTILYQRPCQTTSAAPSRRQLLQNR